MSLFRTTQIFAACAAATMLTQPTVAAEVCGDGLDNNSDGQADEGCWPAGVTGVCESPLSCAKGGAISPKTGGLVYRLPPDLTPRVPHGPGIAFQRVYSSKYAAQGGLPTTSSKESILGYRFQHNFMSYINLDGGIPVVHLPTGQDVKFPDYFTYLGITYYQAQPGHHFRSLNKYADGTWKLFTLTGVAYHYDTDELLVKIEYPGDAGSVDLTYDTHDRVTKVEHSTGNKWLEFEYQSSGAQLLEYVMYFTMGSSEGVRRSTVKFIYTDALMTSVEVGERYGTLTEIQSYTYDGDDYLTTIKDGEGNEIASFNYVDSSAGQVAQVETGSGDIGYEYSPNPTECDGTYLFYHRKDETSCDQDSECGTGYCGGETDSSASDTGTCYRVRRCVLVDSPNEDLVTAVSAECDGASCPSGVTTKEYDWETGTGDDKIELIGTKSADNVWTSYEYNSKGRMTKMVEADTDSDASTEPTGSRATHYFYTKSTFPGLVTEVRKLSELKPSGSCSASVTTDCSRRIYSYDSDGNRTSSQKKGFTYNSSGTIIAFDYTTSYSYGDFGLLTQITGARPGVDDNVEFTHHDGTDPLLEGFREELKRKIGTSTYVTTTFVDYDPWGQASEIEDPDGNRTCYEFDEFRGWMTSRRRPMNNQTNCTTAHSSDLEAEFTRDTWGRITKSKKPAGNCVHYEYDSEGRLEKTKLADDCVAANAHYFSERTYSVDGLLTKVEHKYGSIIKYQQEYTHRADRRIGEIINPASTTDSKTLTYHDDGQLKAIEDEDGLGKTEFDYDDLNRQEEIRRYTDGTNYDTWELTNTSQLDLLTKALDDDSKAIDFVYDDLGRQVKLVSPETGTILWIYNEANNIETVVMADGTSSEMSHAMVFDSLNRQTSLDSDGTTCGSSEGADIQRTFDALPSGVSCPSGADCANISGRIAHVKTKLWCDTTESDDTFDQETFYSYDDNGRIETVYIKDDSGRTAETNYTWTDNGQIKTTKHPSGTTISKDYGTASITSDLDDQYSTYVSGQTIVSGALWEPFGGPPRYWSHNNKRDGNWIRRRTESNKAYRPTKVRYLEQGGPDLLLIDHDEDTKGRITERVFGSAHSGVQDAYYTFDDLDRVICDSAASGSCPTSGSNLKSNFNGSSKYNASGERTQLLHASTVYGTETYPVTYSTGTDKISTVGIGTGSRTVTFTFDDMGMRTSEDDSGLSNDKRDFTYDRRGNLTTVRGKYKPTSGSAWRYYTATNAYDENGHRIFKSFLDEDTDDEAQWFFYYDIGDRLIEVKHIPDVTDTSTYSVFQFFWMKNYPVHYYQIDYPSATTTKRYLHVDEIGRPLEVWSFPASGDTQRVWAINPDVFAWDDILLGDDLYQPLRFPGQHADAETTAWEDFDTPARPPLHYNYARHYDPFTGMYLQTDPLLATTRNAYGYADNSPVQKTDPDGRKVKEETHPCHQPGSDRPDNNGQDGGGGPRRGGSRPGADPSGPTWEDIIEDFNCAKYECCDYRPLEQAAIQTCEWNLRIAAHQECPVGPWTPNSAARCVTCMEEKKIEQACRDCFDVETGNDQCAFRCQTALTLHCTSQPQIALN